VIGCVGCGVPNRVARTWPEAYRALARELDFLKQAALEDDDRPLSSVGTSS
jgi:hypothetical protein